MDLDNCYSTAGWIIEPQLKEFFKLLFHLISHRVHMPKGWATEDTTRRVWNSAAPIASKDHAAWHVRLFLRPGERRSMELQTSFVLTLVVGLSA